MKRIRDWFASKKKLMAKTSNLARQVQEAWDERDSWKEACVEERRDFEYIVDQLHRVARERDQERKKRIDAENALIDSYLDRREDAELERAAEELRDVYLAELSNEEE